MDKIDAPSSENEEQLNDVQLELMLAHVQSVASSVFGLDFLFQTGYSEEHNAFILTVMNPRIEDTEKATITAAIPAKYESILGARFFCTKAAAFLFQVEHDKPKSGLIVPENAGKLVIPGQ